MHRSIVRTWLSAAALVLVACTDPNASEGSSSGSSSAGVTSTSATEGPPSTGPDTATQDPSTDSQDPDSGTEDTDNTIGFVPELPDFGPDCGLLSQCDEFAQDCPEGEKCGPTYIELCGYAITSCHEVVDDGAPGEPCELLANSQDSCDEQTYCYPAALGFEHPSTCVSFCQGTWDDPSCPEGTACALDSLYYGSQLGCQPTCDPLAPDLCGPEQRCTLGGRGTNTQEIFTCMLAPATLAPGQVCHTNQLCDGGLCLEGGLVEDCPDARCCAALCDTLAPDCPVGQNCVLLEIDDPASTVGTCQLD